MALALALTLILQAEPLQLPEQPQGVERRGSGAAGVLLQGRHLVLHDVPHPSRWVESVCVYVIV